MIEPALLRPLEAEDSQRHLAGGLARRGIEAGQRVLVEVSSDVDRLNVVLAAMRCGIVPVVLHASLLRAERDALVADAQPTLVVDDAELARLGSGHVRDLAPWPMARPMHYTSGTTGTPKGVYSGVLSEAEAEALFEVEADLWELGAGDRHLVCSPLHHSVTIRFAGHTLLRGGDVVLGGPFDAHRAAHLLEAERITTTFMAPAHLRRLADAGYSARPEALRLLAHAGSPCPDSLKRWSIETFGVDVVWEFYGSTEGQFTRCSASEWLERPGTVGRQRPDRRLSIAADGGIWCDAPSEARFSYWGDPERTAQAQRTPSQPILPNGATAWRSFTVGDLGRLDDEGYLWIDGRRNDLIITGGVNVYPVEVEKALATLEGVADVAVFGVADDRWGQRVCAAVVGSASVDEVLAGARRVLAPHKAPKTVVRVDEVPTTATGKVQRTALAGVLGLEDPER